MSLTVSMSGTVNPYCIPTSIHRPNIETEQSREGLSPHLTRFGHPAPIEPPATALIMAYRILNATPSDIPALAELLVLTLGSTAMYDVMFPSDPEHAMQKIMHEGRLKGMFEDPKARVFKMVEVSSNGEPTESTMPNGDASVGAGGPGPRIVGSVALTLSDGEVQDGPLGPGTATAYGNRIRSFQFPPQVNGKACEAIIGGVARLIDTMQGRHYGE